MRILLDCDGILADFATPYLNVIKNITGKEFTADQLDDHNILRALDLENYKSDIDLVVNRKGYCESIPIYPEAKDGFNELKKLGEVIIVTAPMNNSPTWVYERTVWLQEYFGVDKKSIVFTSSKSLVQGNVFVDDYADNCYQWEANNVLSPKNPDNVCLMWDRPWNKYSGTFSPIYGGILKVKNWDHLCGVISGLQKHQHQLLYK